MERLKEIERKIEWRDREERKRNVIIKGVEIKEGKRREAVEKVLEIIRARVEVREVKRIARDGDREGEMTLVRLGSEEQRKEVMERKAKLREKNERVIEDWIWKERRLEEIARIEEGKGRRGYGMIRLEGQWWFWDEEEEVLRDGKGRVWRGRGKNSGGT